MQCNRCCIHEPSDLPKPRYPCHPSHGDSCSPCQKLEKLESQIAKTKTMLNSLLTQHRQVRKEINHSHDPIVHRVPPEIASYIFEVCISQEAASFLSERFVTHIKFSAPLVFGAVCSTWRQIAWKTPRLWTCISIPLYTENFPVRYDLVRDWLSRSGQLPLSINVYSDIFREVSSAEVRIILPLIDILNQCSGRWEYLSLSAPSFVLSQLSSEGHGVSILKRLRLFRSDDLRDPNLGDKMVLLADGRHVPTDIAASNIRLKSIGIEWNNATRVKLDGLHVDECLELLRRTPKLTHCEFDNVEAAGNYFQIPSTAIIHRTLQELDFSYGGHDVELFFDKLIPPALDNLRWYSNDSHIVPSQALILFLERSSCRLKELSILDPTLRDSELFPLLRKIPSLQRLHLSPQIWNDHSPKPFFDLLCKTSSILAVSQEDDRENEFLPNLRSLTYYSTYQVFDWTIVPQIFGPLMEINNPCRRPLRSLEILICRPDDESPMPYIDQETLLLFNELEDAGVSLHFIEEFGLTDVIAYSIAHHRGNVANVVEERDNF